jgi:NAD(P)-dependent dehydrogenase (short-subunit alcohol dehydrogenase family)
MYRRHSQSHAGLITAGAFLGLAYGLRTAVRLRRHITFAGKTVLIIGGSRGLGLVLARKFAEERANVAICARDEKDLTVARDELRSYDVDVLGVQCDVSSRQQVTGMIDGLTRHFGMIDALINDAATPPHMPRSFSRQSQGRMSRIT